MIDVGVLQLNVVNVIKAVPEIAAANVPVEPVAWPLDFWAVIPEGLGIGVAITNGKWDLAQHDLSYYEDQPAGLRVQVAIKTDSPKDNTEGLTGPGQMWDLFKWVLKARAASIEIPGETAELHLAGSDFALVPSKTRAEGGAGPLALVISFQVAPIAL